ncbi:hypothetical protein AB0L85_20285 [Streptomyces sp. NPDC052051]|uniref:hypothetical protein n=1 Tax=Streptomyces sp. NPDC052051 TaxID=3154649 RepID=UPI003447DDF4
MSALPQRTARTGCDLRVLRAAVFAAVCVALAAAGHGLASCAAVPLWTLGAGFLGIFVVATALAGRERSLPGIAALLVAGQTMLHMLFGLGQHSTAVPMTPGATPDPTLVERAARIMCGAGTLSPAQAQKILTDARIGTGTGATAPHHPDALSAAGGSWAAVLPSVPMLLAHVLAGVAAGWVLRRGDLALLRIIRLSTQEIADGTLVRSLRSVCALVRALLAGLPAGSGTGPRLPRAWFLVPPKPRTTALQHTVVRRGPPSSTSLALAA